MKKRKGILEFIELVTSLSLGAGLYFLIKENKVSNICVILAVLGTIILVIEYQFLFLEKYSKPRALILMVLLFITTAGAMASTKLKMFSACRAEGLGIFGALAMWFYLKSFSQLSYYLHNEFDKKNS